jgi:Concanavalin A-like lectin/glucanases superfamily
MPLISTLGSAGAQSFGTRGLQVGGSAFFNGGGDALTTAPNNAFVYGFGDFTIEMWVYPLNFADYRFLWQQTSNARDTRFWVYTNINTGQLIYVNGVNVNAITTNGLTLNAWNHVALVRNSSSSRFFLNGVGYSSASDFRNYNTDSTGACIGKLSSVSNLYPWSGNITNVRVTKQAIYTSNFIPSGPLSRNSQNSTTTQLLLNVRSPSTLTTDSGPNNITVNNIGTVTYSALTPFNVPFVTPPVVVVTSAVVTSSTTTPSEGTTITVDVVGTNTPNGTYFYSLEEELATGALTSADFTSGSLTGSFTINGNVGSFPLTVTRDLLTEGTETFTVYVRTGSTSGPIIGASAEIAIQDTSITPVFTVTPASINEGSAGSFTVQNVGPDGTYFFTVLNGTTANADFSAVSGSFVVSGSTGGIDNGSGSFNITPVFDYTTEGAQTFQVQVRSGSTSGPVIITSNSVTINDTSLNPTVSITGATETGFNFSTTGMSSGTFYWTINHITTSPEDFSSDSGSFFRNNNNIEENHFGATVADYVTEGNETFTISVRTGSISGPIIATSSTGTITDTTKTFTVTPSSSTMTEGSTITIFISRGDNLSSIPNGTTLAWSIVHGTTTAADFSGPNNPPFETPTAGLFSIGFGSGSFNITAASDVVFETDETFQVDIRFQNGTLIKRSEVITITGIA